MFIFFYTKSLRYLGFFFFVNHPFLNLDPGSLSLTGSYSLSWKPYYFPLISRKCFLFLFRNSSESNFTVYLLLPLFTAMIVPVFSQVFASSVFSWILSPTCSGLRSPHPHVFCHNFSCFVFYMIHLYLSFSQVWPFWFLVCLGAWVRLFSFSCPSRVLLGEFL